MSLTDRFRPFAVSGFAVLTFVIWVNRIWLAWTNDEDTVAEKIVWSTPITLFVILSVVVLVLMAMARAGERWFSHLVTFFGLGTVLYWIIRMVFIFGGDYDVGFKVVHAVLAAVLSLAGMAAVVAVRGQHRSAAGA